MTENIVDAQIRYMIFSCIVFIIGLMLLLTQIGVIIVGVKMFLLWFVAFPARGLARRSNYHAKL